MSKYKRAFINGKIYTGQKRNPWAVCVKTILNKILFVGNNEHDKLFIDADTEVYDFNHNLRVDTGRKNIR